MRVRWSIVDGRWSRNKQTKASHLHLINFQLNRFISVMRSHILVDLAAASQMLRMKVCDLHRNL